MAPWVLPSRPVGGDAEGLFSTADGNLCHGIIMQYLDRHTQKMASVPRYDPTYISRSVVQIGDGKAGIEKNTILIQLIA